MLCPRNPRTIVGPLILAALVAMPAYAAEPAPTTNQGRILFARHCASCHGAAGRGGGPDADLFPSSPRDLHDGLLDKYDDATLARRIREGRRLPLFLDVEALRRHVDDVESIITHVRRLPDLDWSAIDPGWSAYVARCEVCHGPTGDGPASTSTESPPTNLAEPASWKATEPAERPQAIRHEREGMPALDPAVEEEEGKAIAAFIDLFSPGFSLYSRHCASCHADDGRGVATLGELPGDPFPLPDVAFDAAYFRTADPDRIRDKVWHMLETKKPSMPHFRVVLEDSEIAAIIGYLRATERK